jgi:hypothetical protein
MKTATMTVERIEDDPEVQAARAQLVELRRRLEDAEARSARRWGEPQRPDTREQREAREEAAALQPAVTAAELKTREVEAPARRPLVTSRRPGRVERLRQLLDTVEAAHVAAVDLRDWDVATAHLCGLGDEQAEAHPVPDFLDVRDAVARLRQLIDPAPAPEPDPPRPGQVRVNVIEPFLDREWMNAKRYPGVADLDEATAKQAIKAKWAVEV